MWRKMPVRSKPESRKELPLTDIEVGPSFALEAVLQRVVTVSIQRPVPDSPRTLGAETPT
jgi:hypothetical protein